jgi:uncharacterized phage protein gp47/JayE
LADEIVDLFPLKGETPESVLARLQADQNAGIDPTDPVYADILPGSVWDDLERADALEFDRVYDRMTTEVPAAALPALATGLWLDAWADTLGLERTAAAPAGGTVRFSGADGIEVGVGTQVSTEQPDETTDPVAFQTTAGGTITGGHVDLAVVAVNAGAAGDVAANSVTLLDTPLSGAVTVSNAAAMTGGADVESDEHLQGRIVEELRGSAGAGNRDWYRHAALNEPGVGYVTVLANTPSTGHVTVVISDPDNKPVPSFVVDALQARLDPSATTSQGDGDAPVGATVVVETITTTNVTVAATIVPVAGYSVDGAGGTISLRPDITASVREYVNGLPAGASVLHNKVLAAIVDVTGVVNVSALTLNGGGGDVSIGSTAVAELVEPLTLS